MTEYNYTDTPIVADIEAITEGEARTLAQSFLESQGVKNVKLDITLHIRFLAVFRFAAVSAKSGKHASGWVIGGRAPHLELNDTEISTPIEALAIYALYLHRWIDFKGIPDPEGSVPIYRVPPSWNPLSFTPGFEESHLGAITSYIAWNLVRKNPDVLPHPDIREKCIRRGWIK